MTAPAGRGQETVENVYKNPPLSVRGSGKAAAMALRAPCNGIQIKDNKQTVLCLLFQQRRLMSSVWQRLF